MKKMKIEKTLTRGLAGVVQLDSSPWSVSAWSSCSSVEDFQFLPKVEVLLNMSGKSLMNDSITGTDLLDRGRWGSLSEVVIEKVCSECLARGFFVPLEEHAIIRELLDRSRVDAMRAAVVCQAKAMIGELPSDEAVLAWREAEISLVMSA